MNLNRVLLGVPFLLATIASVLYFQKGHGVGLFFVCVAALLVAAIIGFCFAYADTKDADPADPTGEVKLDDKEAQRAITVGIGTFSLVATLLMFFSLNVADFTVIEYRMANYNHGFEITVRVVIAIVLAAVFFFGNFMLLSWLVPWTGRTFHKKVASLSAAPVAVTPPATPVVAPAAAAATTAATTTTTTAAPVTTPAPVAEEKKTHPMTILFIVIVVGLFLSTMLGWCSNGNPTTPPVVTPPVVTQPDPNAPIVLQDETGAINH